MAKIGAFGLGGTNVSVGIVDSSTGQVEGFQRTALDNFSSYEDCFENFIRPNIPSRYPLGGCIAGAVDEEKRVANHMANSPFSTDYNFGRHFSDYSKFTITGDVRGEGQGATRWLPKFQNKLVLTATFSSGYGIDLVKDGVPILPNPIEAGHGPTLHLPKEFSFYNGMKCGCLSREGKHESHIEAYVSANASANMARKAFTNLRLPCDHPLIISSLDAYNLDPKNSDKIEDWSLANNSQEEKILSYLTGEMVYRELKRDPESEPQKTIRDVQEYAITQAFLDMSSHFNPDTVLVKGSLAEDEDNWRILFEPAIKRAHQRGLANFNEGLLVTRLDNDQLGVMGGAADWLRKNSS